MSSLNTCETPQTACLNQGNGSAALPKWRTGVEESGMRPSPCGMCCPHLFLCLTFTWGSRFGRTHTRGARRELFRREHGYGHTPWAITHGQHSSQGCPKYANVSDTMWSTYTHMKPSTPTKLSSETENARKNPICPHF